MSVFKRRRFPAEIILICVRWYCKYGISYRDLAEMMQERGVAVDHTTIFRWVQRYAPGIEKRVRWYQGYRSASWRVDETYVRVGGAWKYLCRAVDKTGRLIDFMLSDRRNTRAAHRFLSKALKTMRDWPPISITTDKLGSYPDAIRRLQRDGQLSRNARHRTSRPTLRSFVPLAPRWFKIIRMTWCSALIWIKCRRSKSLRKHRSG